MPVDHRSFFAGKVNDRGADVAWFGKFAAGDFAGDEFEKLRVLEAFARQVRFDERGGHGVDSNAMLGPFDAERARELNHRAFRGAIDGLAWDADQAGLAGDEDDTSPAAFDHAGSHGLSHEEAAADVGGEMILPVIR